MRSRLALVLVLFAVALVQRTWAADEIDAKMLVGQWVPVQVPERLAPSFARNFAKGGKYSFGTSLKLVGTYKVEGTKLTIKFDDVPGVPGEVQVLTIKKLTDTELVLGAGKTGETYKRLK